MVRALVSTQLCWCKTAAISTSGAKVGSTTSCFVEGFCSSTARAVQEGFHQQHQCLSAGWTCRGSCSPCHRMDSHMGYGCMSSALHAYHLKMNPDAIAPAKMTQCAGFIYYEDVLLEGTVPPGSYTSSKVCFVLIVYSVVSPLRSILCNWCKCNQSSALRPHGSSKVLLILCNFIVSLGILIVI